MKTIIIAEAGVNHNGDLANAFKLVDAAVEAGADFVKFQTFKAEKLASKTAKKAAYQVATTGNEESQLEMLKKLELSDEHHKELIGYCRKKGIEFLSTPFDVDSIGLLEQLGIRLGKIPSGEITNLPYLRKMARSFEKLILSTGMSDLEEVGNALNILTGEGKALSDITVLHCTTEYPCPLQDVNLLAMVEMKERLGVEVGYSDHTMGIEVPVAAVALGASLIEKHFTIDRTLEGPDHLASLEPDELIQMVRSIRNIEKALGSATKQPSPSEMKNKTVARKSIVAARTIVKGEKFTEENLAVKRPATGISPMRWDELLGQTATRDFDEDELIELE